MRRAHSFSPYTSADWESSAGKATNSSRPAAVRRSWKRHVLGVNRGGKWQVVNEDRRRLCPEFAVLAMWFVWTVLRYPFVRW